MYPLNLYVSKYEEETVVHLSENSSNSKTFFSSSINPGLSHFFREQHHFSLNEDKISSVAYGTSKSRDITSTLPLKGVRYSA